MSIFADIRAYRAFCRLREAVKQMLKMTDKHALASKSVWGVILWRLADLWAAIGTEQLHLDQSMEDAIYKLIMGLALLFGGAGVRDLLGRAVDKTNGVDSSGGGE